MQADDEIDSLEVGVRDVADLEPEPVRVEPTGERLALRDHVLLHVEAEEVDRAAVAPDEQVVQREGEVGAPRAEVDDPEIAGRQRRDDVLDELDEAIDLPELRPPWRAHLALGGLDAELDEVGNGLALREDVALRAVVRERRLGPGRRSAEDARLAAARQHLPVGLGLVQERLPVAGADRVGEERDERASVEELVRRPGREVPSDAPAQPVADRDRVDRQPRGLGRVGRARSAQRRAGERRVGDEPLEERRERHASGAATTQTS